MPDDEECHYRLIMSDELGPDTVFLHMPPERALKLAEKLLQLVDMETAEVSIPVFGRLESIEAEAGS